MIDAYLDHLRREIALNLTRQLEADGHQITGLAKVRRAVRAEERADYRERLREQQLIGCFRTYKRTPRGWSPPRAGFGAWIAAQERRRTRRTGP